MKKLLLLFLPFFYIGANAQTFNTKAFSVGLEVGIPSQSVYNVGLGGSGKAEVPVASNVSLSFTAGYTSFYYKKSLIGSSVTPDAGRFFPLKAGVKYYFSEGFYAEGEAGSVIETNYNKDNLFAFSIGPGFVIATGKHTGVDMGFRYENWSRGRLRQTALRVAYRFGW